MAGALENLIHALGGSADACFRLRFAGGAEWQSRDGAPQFTIHFNTRGAERRTLLMGHVGLLESYFDGSVDVDGDLGAAFRMGMQSRFDRRSNPLVWLRNQWHELTRSNRTLARAKANARFHYGLGADFYGHWLDRELMMYTCAYWQEGTRSLEEAQRNKVEHVCRKLRLRPGDSVVDIGTGFGGFMFHAVEHHGIHGCALNTTTEQVAWLRFEVARRGMSDRILVREADFRQVDGEYDKVVSIGVLEHAGRDQLAEVIRAHAAFLKPGGLGMLHFIGHVGMRDTEFYIREYVFPGGWIPGLAGTISHMERCGLEIVDVENLRRHYAPTLDAWAQRFDAGWDGIRALDSRRFNDRFRRIWRTYLYSCAEMFRSPAGQTHLFQIVFSKGNTTSSSYPMSRRFLYP